MKNSYFYCFSFLLIFSTTSFSQGWQMIYPDSFSLLQGFHAEQTPDGGYIFVGESDYPTGAIRHYIHLVKTDEQGVKQWGKTFNTGGMYPPVEFSQARSIKNTADGGFLIGGTTQKDGNHLSMLLVKTTSNGDTSWTSTVPSLHNTYGHSVLIDDNGDYLIAGKSVELINGLSNIILAKINTNGALMWSKQYYNDGNHNSELQDIKMSNDQAYIMTGSLDNQLFVMKTDLQGDSLWTKTFSLSTQDNGYAVSSAADGSYIVGGSASGFAGNYPIILKLSATGEKLWENSTLSLSSSAIGKDLIIDDDQNIVVTGSMLHFYGGANMHGFLAKLDMNGSEIWLKNFNTIGNNYQGSSVRQTTDGGYLIGGAASGGMLLLKTNKAGEFDATNELSPALQIANIQIHPNPATELIHIDLGERYEGSFQVYLYDSKGMLACRKTLLSKDGKLSYPISFLAKAIYLVQVKQKDKLIAVGKVAIQ